MLQAKPWPDGRMPKGENNQRRFERDLPVQEEQTQNRTIVVSFFGGEGELLNDSIVHSSIGRNHSKCKLQNPHIRPYQHCHQNLPGTQRASPTDPASPDGVRQISMPFNNFIGFYRVF